MLQWLRDALGPVAAKEPDRAARPWQETFRQFALVGSLVLLLLVGVMFNMIVHTVHFGEAGVLFKRFSGGTVTDRVLGEGLQIIWPWDVLYVYDVKVQERPLEVDVLMTNGLTMQVGVSVRFVPSVRDLGRLHQQVGPTYERKILVPVVGSAVREVLGKYLPEELYSQKRETLQQLVEERCRLGVADKFVEIDRVIIRSITMPRLINDSIEAKLEQQQKFEEYVFRIQKEKQEAERKRIEAEGILAYQTTIAKGLTPAVLQYSEIQMKSLLALSGNARTVIMDLSTTPAGGRSGTPSVMINLPDDQVSPKQNAGSAPTSVQGLELAERLTSEGLLPPPDRAGGGLASDAPRRAAPRPTAPGPRPTPSPRS